MSVRRLVCSLLVMVVGVLGLASAPALAAPLEAPDLTVESVAATTATLHGVLNPSKASEAGTYEFIYKQGKAGCVGGTKVPVPPGLMTGAMGEPAYEGISGLVQRTEYTACLRAVNTTSSPTEEATSAAVTFTTAIPPETPIVVSPLKSVTATTATLEGVLNPHAAGDPGSYEFLYSPSATGCEGGEVSGGNALGGKEEAVKAEVTLLPNTTYTFCLRARNEAGEESALSTPATFTTPAVPAAVEGESYSGLDATEARLEARVNSGHAETAYHFEYGPSAGSYDVSLPAAEIRAGLTGVEVSTVATGLTPSTTYHYRVVVSNSQSPAGGTPGPDEAFTTPAAQSKGSPPACSNEQRRGEQPYGLELPDCRAYEMVSPVDTVGQDATDPFVGSGPRAATSGEAVTYASRGDFANPTGDTYENQFLSRRGPEGWSTQEITPLHDPNQTEIQTSYEAMAFTPELTAGIASTNASLTGEAPVGQALFGLYVDDFASNSYRYVAGVREGEANTLGTSTDLSHVVFGGLAGSTDRSPSMIRQWLNGKVIPVGVANDGEGFEAGVGAAGGDVWHAVSADGSRVFFSRMEGMKAINTIFSQEPASLEVRVNAEQSQSPIAQPETSGTGTVTAGSKTVTSLAAAVGVYANTFSTGATKISVLPEAGKFVVGQEIKASSIAPGTTITAITENGTNFTLSAPLIGEAVGSAPISSAGPEPFEVGQRVAGSGIAPGTTIAAVSAGSLTLSTPAASSGSDVTLNAGGGCTESDKACTIDVSASQRTGPQATITDGAGPAPSFWGASANGSKVFFTSRDELTNDANTGVSDLQEIVIGANGGTYTLTFKGQTTSPISRSANTSEVQSRLEALSSIGADNVSVSENSGTESDVVTFKGALAGSEQPALVVDGSSLTGGQLAEVKVLSPPGNDLYEYDLESGKLTDLSADATDTNGAEVLGVVQISEEGSYVYFVAKGDLAEGDAVTGEPNLYVSHEGGPPRFIAKLAAADSTVWQDGGPANNDAVVTPDGTRLAFMSEQSLTGYDSEQAEPGECEGRIGGTGNGKEFGICQEIYIYNAETGGLACASCNPSGARPVGPSNLTIFTHRDSAVYRQGNLLEDGTLFFDSTDALVPHASDGRENVYEYEDGSVYPISDVAGGYESFFLDASPNGENVFFATADQLLPQDTSNNVVVYDARVGGGYPVTVSPPPCNNGDSCKPPPAPQPGVFGAPGSATFSGPGNISPVVAVKPAVKAKAKSVKCRKGYEKKKDKCVKTRKSKKKAKKSTHSKGSK